MRLGTTTWLVPMILGKNKNIRADTTIAVKRETKNDITKTFEPL
jgi:hypothetical protein